MVCQREIDNCGLGLKCCAEIHYLFEIQDLKGELPAVSHYRKTHDDFIEDFKRCEIGMPPRDYGRGWYKLHTIYDTFKKSPEGLSEPEQVRQLLELIINPSLLELIIDPSVILDKRLKHVEKALGFFRKLSEQASINYHDEYYDQMMLERVRKFACGVG